jgi:hypothetical protein
MRCNAVFGLRQVVGRYYSPRTVQLDGETLGTVFVQVL